MPVIKFPAQNKRAWTPNYAGDYSGIIGLANRINLHGKPGKVSAGDKIYPHSINTDSGLSNITVASDFALANTDATTGLKYWAVDSYGLWNTANINTKFAADALTSSPIAADGIADSDLIVYGKTAGGKDILLVSLSADIARFNNHISTTTWDNNWWTDTGANNGLAQPALEAGYPHPLETFGNGPVLFIGDKNKLHSIRTPGTDTVHASETDVSNTRLLFPSDYEINWIKATRDKVFIGLANPLGISNVGYSAVVEYDPYNETVRQIDVFGSKTIGFIYENVCYIIDSKGFVRGHNGSKFEKITAFPNAYIDAFNITLPHRNGIIQTDRTMKVNMPPFYDDPRMPAGVWCIDLDTKEVYNEGSPMISKTDNNTYGYIGGTTTAGAMFLATFLGSFYFMGASPFSTGTTEIKGVYSNSPLAAITVGTSVRGCFWTAKIAAPEVNAVFTRLLIKYNGRRNGTGTGSILVKYRISEPTWGSIPETFDLYTGTWSALGTTFTSTNIDSLIGIGDEVMITKGNGAGFAAHVLTITGTSTKTIVLDEAHAGFTNGQTFSFICTNFKKIGTITDLAKRSEIIDIPDDANCEWIQFSFELRNDIDMEECQVGYQTNMKLEGQQVDK